MHGAIGALWQQRLLLRLWVVLVLVLRLLLVLLWCLLVLPCCSCGRCGGACCHGSQFARQGAYDWDAEAALQCL